MTELASVDAQSVLGNEGVADGDDDKTQAGHGAGSLRSRVGDCDDSRHGYPKQIDSVETTEEGTVAPTQQSLTMSQAENMTEDASEEIQMMMAMLSSQLETALESVKGTMDSFQA